MIDTATKKVPNVVKKSETKLDIGSYELTHAVVGQLVVGGFNKIGMPMPGKPQELYKKISTFYVVGDFYLDHGNGD